MSAGNLSTPAVALPAAAERSMHRLRCYLAMVKSPQTGLLLVTAAAGYISGCCLNVTAASLTAMLSSLFLAISGSTVLNMLWDADIDGQMQRTARRPLPSGQVGRAEAGLLGGLLTGAGLAWAATLSAPFGLVVLAGVFFDVVIYTMLLKRRTPFAIVVGGLAGGMPALAGRVLATGRVDALGLLLALGVLLWIPTHILTFTIKYQADYDRAGIPTFPACFGVPATRAAITASTLLAVLAFLTAGHWIGMSPLYLGGLGVLGVVLVALVTWSLVRPHPRLNFALYKGASIYMAASMLLIIAGGW